MPFSRKIIVHVLCLLLGGGTGLIMTFARKQNTDTSSIPQSRLTSSSRKQSDSIEDKIQSIIDEEKHHRASITKVSVREYALECIKNAPEELTQDEKQFETWLAAAKRIEQKHDLGQELTQALIQDDVEQIGPVMIAWFLRNPSEAFEQFRLRPALIEMIDDLSPLWHVVELEDMKAFTRGLNMPNSMRLAMIDAYAIHLGYFGRLDPFLELLSEQKGFEAASMSSSFAEVWLPIDPDLSASFFHKNLDTPAIAILMEQMLFGVPNPRPLWTESFGKALLAKPLGALEPFREKIEGEVNRIDNALGDSFYFGRDDSHYLDEPRFPGAMMDIIDIYMNRDAGWEDRIVRGDCEIDEIENMLLSRIPQAADHLPDFHKAMLKKLWIHKPAETMKWARERLSNSDIQKSLSDQLKFLNEPRASRLSVLIESLEGLKFEDHGANDWVKNSQLKLEKWQENRRMKEASKK